jgi:3-hydroxyisobutyrate dehydrogenase-like beta-hydroxyacid dehydrogenase
MMAPAVAARLPCTGVSRVIFDPTVCTMRHLTSILFSAPVYKTYGALIADRKFLPAGFAAPLGQKDIRLALAAAEELSVPLPLASLLRDRFLTLMAHRDYDYGYCNPYYYPYGCYGY